MALDDACVFTFDGGTLSNPAAFRVGGLGTLLSSCDDRKTSVDRMNIACGYIRAISAYY